MHVARAPNRVIRRRKHAWCTPSAQQFDRVRPEPQSQRLQPQGLAWGHVPEVDVGAESPNKPGLLILARSLEHKPLQSNPSRDPLGKILSDQAFPIVEAHRSAFPALKHNPLRASFKIGAGFCLPCDGLEDDRWVLGAYLRKDLEVESRLADEQLLVATAHLGRPVGDFDSGETDMSGPCEEAVNAAAKTSHLQQRASGTGQDLVTPENVDLGPNRWIDIRRSPSELPYIRNVPDPFHQRLECR